MQTARLCLRPLETSDAGVVAALAGDWDIARMTGRIPHPYSIIDADQWISTLTEDEFVRGVEYGGRLIGAVGYVPDDDGAAEIGYWIGKPWWGHGYATEAAGALVEHCFRTERRQRLRCCHFVDNTASARVISKLGFRLVGRGEGWCEARRVYIEILKYERRLPLIARLGAFVS